MRLAILLRIVVENTDAPASPFSYTGDRAGSKASRDIQIEGWRVTGLKVEEQTYIYDTAFGDPVFEGKGKSDYARTRAANRVPTRILIRRRPLYGPSKNESIESATAT